MEKLDRSMTGRSIEKMINSPFQSILAGNALVYGHCYCPYALMISIINNIRHSLPP
ncbi:hypothetical protein GBA52_005072 [Prunus armeniaca]|nr:hypothetical protein GBA52_005072 [Prunus armeniaca]